MSKPSAIEQMEAAGILNAKNLDPDVANRINHSTSDETVEHIIEFKKSIDEHRDCEEPKPWTPDNDGSMF
jgi:hypothetical protein